MKKVAFILASMLVVMLSGCGEGSSTSATPTLDTDNLNIGTSSNVVKDVQGLTQFPAVPAIPES